MGILEMTLGDWKGDKDTAWNMSDKIKGSLSFIVKTNP